MQAVPRKTRKFRQDDLTLWREVTLFLGYGPKSMVKVLRMLLAYAKSHPDYFRRRP